MLEHDRRDVSKGPLGTKRGIVRAAADEEQRAEGVAGVQRAVAATARVAHAAPVDGLVAGRQGDDKVTRVRSSYGSEDAGERVGVLIAAKCLVFYGPG